MTVVKICLRSRKLEDAERLEDAADLIFVRKVVGLGRLKGSTPRSDWAIFGHVVSNLRKLFRD
jgi:hypothetical protein